MATNKRVFTLRLSDEVFDKIGVLATKEHRSITNYIEYVLLKHLEEVEREQGEIDLDAPEGDLKYHVSFEIQAHRKQGGVCECRQCDLH